MFLKDQVSELFIAVPESAKHQLAFKWPNSSIKKLSAVIVDADEMAVFISRGEVVATFGPGRYKLDAKEWPFLGSLVDWATDGNAYRAELFFISTRQFPNEKFGARVDDVQDPRTGLVVGLQMHGQYALKATDPAKLVLALTGTGVQDNDEVLDWVDQQLIKSLRHYVTSQITSGHWPVLGLSTFLPEIETAGVSAVNEELAEYGLAVPKFGNVDVILAEADADRIKKLSTATAYSQLAGSFGAYAAGEALLGAGEGMSQGGSGNPALLAAGLGIGSQTAGAFAANPSAPVPPHTPATPQGPTTPAAGAGEAAGGSGARCAKCGAAVAGKFCAECGTPTTAVCTKCGAPVTGKFCAECGTPTSQGEA